MLWRTVHIILAVFSGNVALSVDRRFQLLVPICKYKMSTHSCWCGNFYMLNNNTRLYQNYSKIKNDPIIYKIRNLYYNLQPFFSKKLQWHLKLWMSKPMIFTENVDIIKTHANHSRSIHCINIQEHNYVLITMGTKILHKNTLDFFIYQKKSKQPKSK